MSTRNNGGPAFPTPCVNGGNGEYWQSTVDGMSLRDYFAAAALNGLLSAGGARTDSAAGSNVRWAWGYADAMLKERAK